MSIVRELLNVSATNTMLIEMNSELIEYNMYKTAQLTDILYELWTYLMFIWFMGGIAFILLACQIRSLTRCIEELENTDPEKESLLYTKI